MSMHPTILVELADQRRREMIAQAEAHRRARPAPDGRPAGYARLGRATTLFKAVASRIARARKLLPHEA